MELPEDISERAATCAESALKPLSVWAVVQELAVCRGLRGLAAPVAVVKHVWSDVEVAHQHHWPALC